MGNYKPQGSSHRIARISRLHEAMPRPSCLRKRRMAARYIRTCIKNLRLSIRTAAPIVTPRQASRRCGMPRRSNASKNRDEVNCRPLSSALDSPGVENTRWSNQADRSDANGLWRRYSALVPKKRALFGASRQRCARMMMWYGLRASTRNT
jgi:hypothetical protein